MADRRPRRHAGHQGHRVRLPARSPARGGRRRRAGRRGRAGRAAGRARRAAARRSRGRAAPTTPSSCAPATAAPRSTPWGAARRRCSRGCTPRGAWTAPPPSAARATRRSPRRPCATCRWACPKLIVSTVASGDTRPYVGAVDVTMMYSVVDISGINQISAQILTNAAGAIAGMATADGARGHGRAPAGGGDDVRRHHAVRHARARAPGGARLRGARLPRHRHRRAVLRGAGHRRLPRRRARRHHDRAGRRPRRRRPVGRARSPGGRRARRHPAGRLARRAGHGQLRAARHRAAAVRGPQPLRPQPDDHADAHDGRGDGRARAADRAQAQRRRRRRRCSSCR